jgi:hypothetical protein
MDSRKTKLDDVNGSEENPYSFTNNNKVEREKDDLRFLTVCDQITTSSCTLQASI